MSFYTNSILYGDKTTEELISYLDFHISFYLDFKDDYPRLKNFMFNKYDFIKCILRARGVYTA